MNKLLKDHKLNHIHEYFDLIVIAYIQGNEKKVKDRFKVMRRKEKRAFIELTSKGAYEHRLQTKYVNKIIELVK